MVFIHACPYKATSHLDKHNGLYCCGPHFFTLTFVPVSFPLPPCIGTEQPNCDDAGSEERKRQSWIEIHSAVHRRYTIQLALLKKKKKQPLTTFCQYICFKTSTAPLSLVPIYGLSNFPTGWMHYVRMHTDESIYNWGVGLEESWQILALRKNPPSESLALV